MRAEDCYGRHPSRITACPVRCLRRPPDLQRRGGPLSEDNMKNTTTTVVIAAGLVLAAVIVTRTPG